MWSLEYLQQRQQQLRKIMYIITGPGSLAAATYLQMQLLCIIMRLLHKWNQMLLAGGSQVRRACHTIDRRIAWLNIRYGKSVAHPWSPPACRRILIASVWLPITPWCMPCLNPAPRCGMWRVCFGLPKAKTALLVAYFGQLRNCSQLRFCASSDARLHFNRFAFDHSHCEHLMKSRPSAAAFIPWHATCCKLTKWTCLQSGLGLTKSKSLLKSI